MWKWVVVSVCILLLGSAACCASYDQVRKDAEALSKSGHKLAAAALLESAIGSDLGHEAQWLRGYILVMRDAPKADIIAQFLRVVNTFPGSEHAPDALLRVGYLRDKLGDDPGPDWQRLVRDYPQAKEAREALLHIAYRCDKQGGDAGPDWQQLVQEYPGTKEAAEALHGLGHLALRKGNPMLAVAKFDASAAVAEADQAVIYDSVLESGYACISQYWQNHNFEALPEAIRRLNRVETESTDPTLSTKARMGLGEAYLIQGFQDKALAKYQEVLDSKPQDAFVRSVAQFEIGCCLHGKKDYTGALAAFDTFLTGCSGSTLKGKDVAWRAARPGYADLIGKDTERASKLCGLDLIAEAVFCKARELSELHRYDEASQLADQVLNEFPNADCVKRAKAVRSLCNAMRAR